MGAGFAILAIAFAVAEPTPVQRPEEVEKPKPASYKISGHGFWGNLELRKTLRYLIPEDEMPVLLDANFVEDAAQILLSQVRERGYLKPRLEINLALEDESELEIEWNADERTFLPRPLRVRVAHFQIIRGILYYYNSLEIDGLKSMTPEEAERYFTQAEGLFPRNKSRVFTPNGRDQSIANLTEALHRKGYAECQVAVTKEVRDDESGAVEFRVAVREGRQFLVKSVDVELQYRDRALENRKIQLEPVVPYSPYWEESAQQRLKAGQYRQGYPYATTEVDPLDPNQIDKPHAIDRQVRLSTGPRVRLGQIHIVGQERTRTDVIRRRFHLRDGDWMNRQELEAGQSRLLRMGIFKSAQLDLGAVEPEGSELTRDATITVVEGRRIDLGLLFGYGSYEQLRAGVEMDQYNLFGLAHRARLQGIISMKSIRGDYAYTIPEVFKDRFDVVFAARGLQREEIDFTREEYGASLGLQRYFPSLEVQFDARYQYEWLNAADLNILLPKSVERARVGAFAFNLQQDKLDNPLVPHKGYRVYSSLEIASQALGGEVGYQRLEIGTAYHVTLPGDRFIHLGGRHAIAMTLGTDRLDIPFNKRYFPGGENSLRGYQQGEAAPLSPITRQQLGAETYLQGNIEFEQVITGSWSVVGFLDGITMAADLANYPGDEALLSAGGGIRLETIIGPARFEYGHNLNPRAEDPSGTFHFSIGFPF